MDGDSRDPRDRGFDRTRLADRFRVEAVEAVVFPFSRPLWQNLLVPVLGLAVWFGGFHAATIALDTGPVIAADTLAGRRARTTATVVANLTLGVVVGIATATAFGWAIWNLWFPAFLWMWGPQAYLRLLGRSVPEPVFEHGYVAVLGPNAWIYASVFAFLVTAISVAGWVFSRYDTAAKRWWLSMFADREPMGEKPWGR